MIKKYNLALIPFTKSHRVIEIAQQFANIADLYLLGKKSFPHVTLYHFYYEENEIETLWMRVLKTWEKQPIVLSFPHFNYQMFKNIYWISLMPDHVEELHNMHGMIANLLNLPIKDTFDPHMTLINTYNSDYAEEIKAAQSAYSIITDNFYLALGESDNIGQLTNILFSTKIKEN